MKSDSMLNILKLICRASNYGCELSMKPNKVTRTHDHIRNKMWVQINVQQTNPWPTYCLREFDGRQQNSVDIHALPTWLTSVNAKVLHLQNLESNLKQEGDYQRHTSRSMMYH
jgi:hypothetical protein